MANAFQRPGSLEIPENEIRVSRSNSSLIPVSPTEPAVKRAVAENASDWERGRKYKTKMGVRVRSKIEKIIADFLFEKGIRFSYEPIVTVAGWRFRPDFFLPDYGGLIYEHFGLDDDAYQRVAQSKISLYRRSGARFTYTTFADEPDIEDVLTNKLDAFASDIGDS